MGMESILTSIKKLLGIDEADESFDVDIITHINTAFSLLKRLGVGPASGFSISDKESVWSDFIPKEKALQDCKTYIYLKVKLIFDPPQSSEVIKTMKETLSELEWSINVEVEEEIQNE